MSSAAADLLARLPGGSVAPASAALGRLLPVLPPLRPLLPGGGLRRGTTVEVGAALPDLPPARGRAGDGAVGGCSLLLALLAGPSQAGSWCAVVGVPGLGGAAAAEAGVDLSRLVLVPAPGGGWARVAAALADGFDMVVVRPPAGEAGGSVGGAAADRRALSARVRHHGSVLLSLGAWPGADLRLTASSASWEGLGDGHGRFRARRVTVSSGGRGSAGGRPRVVGLWLPASGAPLAALAPAPVVRGEEAV